jgi:hypothetical protein
MDLYESVRAAMHGGYNGNNDLAAIAYDCSVVALKDDVSFPICLLGRNSGKPSVALVHYDAYLKNATTDKFGDTEDDDVTRAFELMRDIVTETVGLFKMLRLELLFNGSKRFSSNFDSQSDKLSTTEAFLLVLGKLLGGFSTIATIAPHCF